MALLPLFLALLPAQSGWSEGIPWQLNGTQDGEELGFSVVSPGNLDGDGTPGMVVGCPGWSGAGLTRNGAVRAVSGLDAHLL